MKKRFSLRQKIATPRPGYLWLALGAMFSCFAVNGRWDLPLAAWLGPFFLLRFTRTSRPLIGFGGVWLVSVCAMFFFLYQAQFPEGLNPLLIVAGLIFGTVLALPYLLDRLITPRIALGSGLIVTLAFPLSRVACEYLISFSPYGSIISLAYTQYGNLPLLQVISLTGIYGISFLMTWFASVGNWVWEQRIAWPRIRAITLLYSSTLVLVLLGGSIRLAFFPPTAQTVRVAGISVPNSVIQQEDFSKRTLAQLRATAALSNNFLLTQSMIEARAGAKIVVWAEKDAITLVEDEASLIERGQTLASRAHIYLDMGINVLQYQPPSSLHLLYNQSILIDPQGRVLWTYNKAHPVPGLENIAPGDGNVSVVDTPYGRLATVICFDADFPNLMQQTGSKSVDIMLVPALDWPGINPWHAENATFRAIEDGYSLVRQTSNGLAMTVDYEGHVLAATDYFTTNQQTMITSVPVQGVWTIYAHVGDLFAWLCLAGLILLMGFVAFTSGRRGAGER
jgi:apolipoprotein N-acyltransferase